MSDLSEKLAAIEALEQAATPGPWGWFGNTDSKSVYLATKDRGRQFIMTFRRWGMQGAQPWFNTNMWMGPASDMPRYEVCPDAQSRDDDRVYRADISGIKHPDAEFIAASREAVPFLLALVRDQAAKLAAVEEVAERYKGIALSGTPGTMETRTAAALAAGHIRIALEAKA